MNLLDLGWTPTRDVAFTEHARRAHVPARVVRQDRGRVLAACTRGIVPATIAGRLGNNHGDGVPLVVGDWVALRLDGGAAVVQAVLPRHSVFSRKRAGNVTSEQLVAANIDWLFLVCGLDRDFNLRRIERALTLVYRSGASPVIVLNKADVCARVEAHIAAVEGVAAGVPICALSARDGSAVSSVLRPYLQRGKTVATVGSSGVGKSTLINALLGSAVQRTAPVRSGDDRGQHTTTHRELFVLPAGGAIIDTPGLRELQLWADHASVDAAFVDIDDIAQRCRFRDCTHLHEPGCAVLAAVEDDMLDGGRLDNYHKMQREINHLAQRQDHLARKADISRWKSIQKDMRKRYRQRWS